MVPAFPGLGIYAPEGVMPSVALFQNQLAGSQKQFLQFLVLGELGPDDFFHNGQLHVFPVGTKLHISAQPLGLVGAEGGELHLFRFVDALLRLEGCLSILVSQALVGHRCIPEVAEEPVFVPEAVDGGLTDAAVFLDQLPDLGMAQFFRTGLAFPELVPDGRGADALNTLGRFNHMELVLMVSQEVIGFDDSVGIFAVPAHHDDVEAFQEFIDPVPAGENIHLVAACQEVKGSIGIL